MCLRNIVVNIPPPDEMCLRFRDVGDDDDDVDDHDGV